jgi:hypothetical protein
MSDDPMDHYEIYSEWLMREFPERYPNGDALIRDFEAGYEFERFINERENKSA